MSKDILALEIIDKREVKLNSSIMEKEGLVRSLKSLEKDELNIVEIVTDAHSQISKYLHEKHPKKKHTWDIWHAAKNLAKKLTKALKTKDTEDGKEWIKDIVRHFWFCVETSDTHSKFTGKWKGVLHHITGKNEWLLAEGSSNEYEHGHLSPTDEKPTLLQGSPSHKAIAQIIWNEKFIKNISYLLNFCSTDIIENFNMLVLKYASK